MAINSFAGSSVATTLTAPAGLLATHASRNADIATINAESAQGFRRPATARPESTLRIGLPQLSVVLSLAAEAADRNVDGLDFPMPDRSDAVSADPVMQRLFNELGRSEGDEDEGAYADAIRIALAARWLRLRSREQEQPADGLQKWKLKRVMAYIDENLGESISLADLARTAGLSRMYFAARFRAATGLRPHDYILRRRVERAKELLGQTEQTLVNIAFDVGFQTQAHFTTVFKRFVGTTPGRWRTANHRFA